MVKRCNIHMGGLTMLFKEEIEDIVQKYIDKGSKHVDDMFYDGYSYCAKSIMHEIDSLQEESTDKDIDIAASQYVSNPENFVDWIGNHGETDDISYIIKAYKAGAKWQKKQMRLKNK